MNSLRGDYSRNKIERLNEPASIAFIVSKTKLTDLEASVRQVLHKKMQLNIACNPMEYTP